MTEPADPTVMHQLVELANKLAWKNPDLNVLRDRQPEQSSPLAQIVQQHLQRSHARARLVLPDLRAFGNQSVAAFSDYGGESSGAYHTYSVLVCGLNLVGPFNERMKEIRAQHKLGQKEIAFKDFRMGQLQRTLPDYLSALNNLLPGFVFTLAVDKRLISLFGPREKSTLAQIADLLRAEGLGERSPLMAEKLVRVVHLAALLCGLLAHDGQKIFWMTDHDAICGNDHLRDGALRLFGRVLPLYTREGCSFPLVGGAVPFKERSVESLDLLSVPDIVAGSLDQYLTRRDAVAEEEIKVKPGADLVLQWLANDGLGLKKMNVIVRPGEGSTIEGATLNVALKNPPTDATIIPITI